MAAKTIIAATMAAISISAHADGIGDLAGADKAKHLAVSAAISSAARVSGMSEWGAVGAAMVPGLAKELYDSRRGGSGWSNADLLADLVGAYLGSKIAGLIIGPGTVSYSVSLNLL